MAGFRRRTPAAASAGQDRTSWGLGGKLAHAVARARSHRRIALLSLGAVLVLAGVAIAGPTGEAPTGMLGLIARCSARSIATIT